MILPYEENPNFVVRQDIADTIHATFYPLTSEPVKQRTFALNCLGGMGKTQISTMHSSIVNYTRSYYGLIQTASPNSLKASVYLLMSLGLDTILTYYGPSKQSKNVLELSVSYQRGFIEAHGREANSSCRSQLAAHF